MFPNSRWCYMLTNCTVFYRPCVHIPGDITLYTALGRLNSHRVVKFINIGSSKMELEAVKFILKAALVISLNLYDSCTSVNAVDPGYTLYREVEFMSQRMSFSNKKVCATQNPDLVRNRVRSSIECTVICKGTEGCSGVNWKKPSTCELYLTKQDTFTSLANCAYFGPGKKFEFDNKDQFFLESCIGAKNF